VELKDYIRVVQRRWMIVVSATILTALGALLFSLATSPTYQATSRVFVSTTGASSLADAQQGDLFSQQRVASYVELAKGSEVAQRTIDALGLDLAADELAKRVVAKSAPDTVLIDVWVTDSTAAGAADITNALTDQLRGVVAELDAEGPRAWGATSRLVVVNRASIPSQPIAPYTSRNVALGAFVGLLLGLAIVIVRDRLDTRVRTSEDVMNASGVEVLGAIPYVKRLRGKTALGLEAWPPANVESVIQLRLRLRSGSPGKVLVLVGTRAEVGTTTAAISIAQAFADSGDRVLLIDANLRRPGVGEFFSLTDSVGLSSVLRGESALSEAVQPTHFDRLGVVAGGAAVRYPTRLLESPAFESVLAEARLKFDRVIVDAGPVLLVTDGVIVAAQGDAVLLVGRHGSTKAENFTTAVSNLNRAGVPLLGAVLSCTPGSKGSGAEYRTSARSRRELKRTRRPRRPRPGLRMLFSGRARPVAREVRSVGGDGGLGVGAQNIIAGNGSTAKTSRSQDELGIEKYRETAAARHSQGNQ
jgi:capsular exopolysaccharide synthesis family protein